MYIYQERTIIGNNIHKNCLNAEFKREAVPLLETSGKSRALIAQELGIWDGNLYTWRRQFAEQEGKTLPGKGHQTPTKEELRQFWAKNERHH